MMLNKLPANTPLSNILKYIDSCPRWSARNRALFALRQVLRLKDIATLRVCDVINPDATIRRYFVSSIDDICFEFDVELRCELERYLRYLYSISSVSLERILKTDTNIPLFSTQKKVCFSPNTLAQHFSYQDRLIHEHFKPATSRVGRPRYLSAQLAH